VAALAKLLRLQNGVLCALLVLFGLSFGLNYGTSNQAVYLLESVRALHPSIWLRDWAVMHNHAYHPVYVWLGALLIRISPHGYAVGAANVLAVAIGMWAIERVLRLLGRADHALAALCVVLLIGSVTRTQAPGGTYAFSEIFQPSTLGSLGVILASLGFVSGSPLFSGLGLVFGGVFHVNYLVLALAVFGSAWLLLERERLFSQALLRKLLLGLGPPLLVLGFFLPFLLTSANTGVAPEAHRIYLDIRNPHHYDVRRFAWDFAFFCGFQAIGAAALLGPARRGSAVHQRALALLVGTWLLVIPAALLSSVVVVRFAQELFAWRICPQADLLAQAAFATVLVNALRDGKQALAEVGRPERVLFSLGMLSIVVGSLVTHRFEIGLVMLLLTAAAWLVTRGFPRRLVATTGAGLSSSAAVMGLLLALVGANVQRFVRLASRSSLLSGAEPGVAELCAWAAANTPENSLFLSPPQEEELRFRCQRSIVVDWKSNPAVPNEVLEWYARIEDVTGVHPVRSQTDLEGYDLLDETRVERLRERYGFDYVVVERGHEIPGLGAPAFSGSRLVAYALPPREATARAIR